MVFRGGTPEFDFDGWKQCVDKHRSADPSISEVGRQQAQALADYLVPHLVNQASQPVQIISSPMRRTLETIRPTLHGLTKSNASASVLVSGFYHESDGCHTKGVPEEGMNKSQIKHMLTESHHDDTKHPDPYESIQFAGFPSDASKGWYSHATGEETRPQSEERAAKFYLWLCEYLDNQLEKHEEHDDVFDAGVAIPGEEKEDEHNKTESRLRKRRTCILMGHGDFMSLVLKRIVSGYGHFVEQQGTPHRSAFVHVNTGITELEYFGYGRFLVMGQNHTPHFAEAARSKLLSGGSLKDGWSFLVPEHPLHSEVKVHFDDEMDEHVREQAQALRALYMKSEDITDDIDPSLSVEEQQDSRKQASSSSESKKHFIIHRGLQVVGCATLSEDSGIVSDVAIRPSAGPHVMESLMQAIKKHKQNVGRSGSILVFPRAGESKALFEEMGFKEVEESPNKKLKMELDDMN